MAKKSNKWNFFKFTSLFKRKPKKITKAQKASRKEFLIYSAKASVIAAALVGIAVGMIYLERYVIEKRQIGIKVVQLELGNEPNWMSDELRTKIFQVAGDGDGKFVLSENIAMEIGSRLSGFSWLYDVNVVAEPEKIVVNCGYYQPVVLLEDGKRKAYLAANKSLEYEEFNLIVLEYVPIYKLPIVKLSGVNAKYMKAAGAVWDKDDAYTAVKLIRLLALMDKNLQEKYAQASAIFQPLLSEIGSIDVSNFGSRKTAKEPAIILYAVDETPIYWGSLDGNLEAVPAEKLGKLYQYYRDYGTLKARSKGDARYIDLRIAEKILPLP